MFDSGQIPKVSGANCTGYARVRSVVASFAHVRPEVCGPHRNGGSEDVNGYGKTHRLPRGETASGPHLRRCRPLACPRASRR